MPITRYAKVLLLAPTIGSTLIGMFGLLLGVALIAHPRPSSKRAVAGAAAGSASAKSTEVAIASHPAPASAHSFANAATPSLKPHLLPAGDSHRSGTPRRIEPAVASVSRAQDTLFQKKIPSDQLKFLTDYAGRPANDVLHEQNIRELVAAVVPYAPFHLGIDMPLPHALESMFAASQVPVAIRDGRYVMVTGMRGQGGRGRAFIWVDTTQGIALGGIFFYPSNGEPTPTLTLFSNQVNRASLDFAQFPPAFIQDLVSWAATEGLPPVTTRYFINGSSEKTVLAHDEDFCKMTVAGAATTADSCSKMNAEAARVDTEASHFLNRANYASNATMRMVDDPSRIGALVAR